VTPPNCQRGTYFLTKMAALIEMENIQDLANLSSRIDPPQLPPANGVTSKVFVRREASVPDQCRQMMREVNCRLRAYLLHVRGRISFQLGTIGFVI